MNDTVELKDLSSVLMCELQAYSVEVDEIMQAEIEKKAKKVTLQLKNNSNIPIGTHDGLHYKNSFYYKKLARGKGYIRLVIANRKYQLTHLLEKGHVTRNGGRTKTYPHWIDAQKEVDKLIDEFARRING